MRCLFMRYCMCRLTVLIDEIRATSIDYWIERCRLMDIENAALRKENEELKKHVGILIFREK